MAPTPARALLRSLPPVEELEAAIEVLCTCLKLAALERLGA